MTTADQARDESAASDTITWDRLADLYKVHTGGIARIRPMERVFAWAESRPDLFTVTSDGELLERKR